MSLAGMHPADGVALTSGAKVLAGESHIIIYLPNPDGDQPGRASASRSRPSVELDLPDNTYNVRWFNPRSGDWHNGGLTDQSVSVLEPPEELQITRWEDWVILLNART